MDELTRLWLSARDGDVPAFRDAVRGSQADVYRLVAHLVGVADAEDVTQDTFVRARRALPRFRADSTARTWLLAIARRACADFVRGSTRRRRLLERTRNRGAGDPGRASYATAEHALHALVVGLEADQRAAFVLTQVVGCSYAEAAEVCDVPIGTIRSRVARARERLVAEVHASEAV